MFPRSGPEMTPLADSFAEMGADDIAGAPTVSPVAMRVVSPAAWEEAAAGFDGVCQEQLLSFSRTRWPGLRQEPVVFSSAGEIVGGSLMMIQPLPLRSGAIAIAKWGPMLADERRADALQVYAGMVEALIADYAQKRRMMVSVLPRAALGTTNPEYDYLMERGFRPGAGLRFPDRYIVNLRLSDEEQRRSLEQKWRYHLNRAEKAGLSFEPGGPERRGEFDALYAHMIDRKRFPDHSAYETVPALLAIGDETLRPELFFVRHESEIVAGAIIFKAGQRAVYLYGATAAPGLPLRAGYFLHWNIIRWLRDNTQAHWYDLGGTDGFHGLHQFKKGMVGSAGVIAPVPRVANYAAQRLPLLLGEGAFAAREVVQSARRLAERLRPDRAKPDQVGKRRNAAGAA